MFSSINTVATKYIKLGVNLVYKHRGRLYTPLYPPMPIHSTPTHTQTHTQPYAPLCIQWGAWCGTVQSRGAAIVLLYIGGGILLLYGGVQQLPITTMHTPYMQVCTYYYIHTIYSYQIKYNIILFNHYLTSFHPCTEKV